MNTPGKSLFSTSLNHQAPYYDGTLNSQGYVKYNERFELYADPFPFLRFMNSLSPVIMESPNKAYAEYIPAWLLNAIPCYYKAGTVTGFSAGVPKDAFTLDFTSTSNGSTYMTTKWNEGDVVVLQCESDISKLARLLLVSLSSNTWTCKLLDNTPGFTPTVATKAYNVGRLDAPGASMAPIMTESEDFCWCTSQEMKESWGLNLEDSNAKGMVGATPQEVQESQALDRLMQKVHDTLLFSGCRIGATAGNPWSLPDKTITDKNSNTMWTTMSFVQACNAASLFGLGTRVKKISKTLATDADYVDNFKEVLRYRDKVERHIGFIGWDAFIALQAFVKSNPSHYNISPETTKHGLNVRTLEFGIGQIDLVPDISLTGAMSDAMILVNPRAINKCHYSSLMKRQLPTDKTRIQGEWYIHTGLRVAKPYSHQVVFWQ